MRKHVVALMLIAAAAAPAWAQGPKTGTEVLRTMHDAYAGKWYRTLTFTQKTTRWMPDGTQRVDTWYESLRHFDDKGTLLRIDIGAPSAGNGLLFSTDSTWIIRGGKLTGVRPHGNEFLPLIEGVYMQPVETTAKQLSAMGFDVNKVTAGEWQGKPVWIVGASSPTDSASTQFWVDKARNIVVRALIASPQGTLHILLNGYEPLEKGWLATKVEMTMGGKPMQTEEYSDWKGNPELSADLFNPATWTSAPHWLKQ